MIEALFFGFGAVVAAFAAVFFDKAIWRRALDLKARENKAATPPSPGEAKASREQRHADCATMTRKVEVSFDDLKKKMHTQIDEIDKKSDHIRQLLQEIENKTNAVRAMEQREAAQKQKFSKLEGEHNDLMRKHQELEKKHNNVLIALSDRDKTIVGLQALGDLRSGEIESLKLKLMHLEADVEAQQSALSKAEQALARERASNGSILTKFEAQERILQEKSQQAGMLQSKVTELTAQLRSQISETERAIFKAQSLVEERHKADEDLSRRATDAELRLKLTLEDMEKTRSERAILEGQLQAAREERNRLSQDIKLLQNAQRAAEGATVPGTIWPA